MLAALVTLKGQKNYHKEYHPSIILIQKESVQLKDERRFFLITKALQPEKFASIVNCHGLKATKKDLSLNFCNNAAPVVTSSTEKKKRILVLCNQWQNYAKKKNGKAFEFDFSLRIHCTRLTQFLINLA